MYKNTVTCLLAMKAHRLAVITCRPVFPCFPVSFRPVWSDILNGEFSVLTGFHLEWAEFRNKVREAKR